MTESKAIFYDFEVFKDYYESLVDITTEMSKLEKSLKSESADRDETTVVSVKALYNYVATHKTALEIITKGLSESVLGSGLNGRNTKQH